MLNVTSFVLIVIWLVGVTSSYQIGGSIHILLLAGIVIFIYKTTKKPRHSEHFESNKRLQLAKVHKEVSEDAVKRLRR